VKSSVKSKEAETPAQAPLNATTPTSPQDAPVRDVSAPDERHPAQETPPKETPLKLRTPTPEKAEAPHDTIPSTPREEASPEPAPKPFPALAAETQAESGKEPDNHMMSFVVIALLFLVLIGAGYGLWKVLQMPAGEKSPAPEAGSAQAPPKATFSPAAAIEKAKTNIAAVPEVPDTLLEDPKSELDTTTAPQVSAATSMVATAPGTQTSEPAKPTTGPATPSVSAVSAVSAASTEAIEKNKQLVSDYLRDLHIGGVRQGERPMVLIDGHNYLVGDTIQAATGLKFAGLRDGRLAFRDKYEIVYLKSF
jgi:hypothetical protein